MAASTPNPQVTGPFTLVYAGNRRGPVNALQYETAEAAITAAEGVIASDEKIIVMGTLLLARRAIAVPSSLVTA